MTLPPDDRVVDDLAIALHQHSCLTASGHPHHIGCGHVGPYLHIAAVRDAVGTLRELGHLLLPAGERPKVGKHPDLVDRQGDRWWEARPDGYRMYAPPGVQQDEIDPSPTEHLPSRADLERDSGPVIEVPRLPERGDGPDSPASNPYPATTGATP